MQCPFDATQLQVVNRSGVEIDWCPSCKGVWLERGELDKLIDLSASPAAASPGAPRSTSESPPSIPDDPLAVHNDVTNRRDDGSGIVRRGDGGHLGRRDDDDTDDWRRGRPGAGGDVKRPKRKNLLSEIFDF